MGTYEWKIKNKNSTLGVQTSTYTPFTLHRRHVPQLEVLLGGETALPGCHILSELFTLQADSHRLDTVFLTVNNTRMTVLQTLVTEEQPQLTFGGSRMNMWRNDQYLNSPYVVLLHWKATESHNLMYTVHHPFGYRISVTHDTEFSGRKFKDFNTCKRWVRIGMAGCSHSESQYPEFYVDLH